MRYKEVIIKEKVDRYSLTKIIELKNVYGIGKNNNLQTNSKEYLL